jgi:hypothetical protein
MKEHISLKGNGMGVELRENRSSIKSLLESYGYDYVICSRFIDEFETELLNSYYDSKDKDSK